MSIRDTVLFQVDTGLSLSIRNETQHNRYSVPLVDLTFLIIAGGYCVHFSAPLTVN